MLIKIRNLKIIVDNRLKKNIRVPNECLLENVIRNLQALSPRKLPPRPDEVMLSRYNDFLKTKDGNSQLIKMSSALKRKKEVHISCGCKGPYKCHSTIFANRLIELL